MTRKKPVPLPYDIEQARPEVQEFYRKLIYNGESPRLAEMLALRSAPRCMTDDVFFGGQTLASQFGTDT